MSVSTASYSAAPRQVGKLLERVANEGQVFVIRWDHFYRG